MNSGDSPDHHQPGIATGDIGGDFVGGNKTSWFSPTKNIHHSAEAYRQGQEDKAREFDARIAELERARIEAIRQEGRASGKAELLQERLTVAKSARAAVEATLVNLQTSYETALTRIEDLQRQIAALDKTIPKELIAEIETALGAGDLDHAEELIAPLFARAPV